MYEKHKVDLIEGVGPQYSKALNSIGVHYCEDLLFEDYATLKQLAPSGISRRLEFFIQQARLIQVTRSGQMAEALHSGRVKDLDNLRIMDPDRLVLMVKAAEDKGLINETIDEVEALRWITRATQFHFTGFVAGHILDQKEEALSGAVIKWQDQTASSMEDGTFWLPGIPYGKHRLFIQKQGFKTRSVGVDVKPSKNAIYRVILEEGADTFVNGDERNGDVLSFHPTDQLKQMELKTEDVPDGLAFYYSFDYKNGDKKFHTIQRRKENGILIIDFLRLPGDVVEESSTLGDTFEWHSGKLLKTGKTVEELRAINLFKPALEDGHSVSDLFKS